MASEFFTLVKKHLEPTLVRFGFAEAQGGAGEDSAQVIFCSSAENFFERFQHSDLAGDQPDTGGCMDILVDAVLTDRWHATGVRLNGVQYSTPELPKQSLETEVIYIAERFLPMITGDAPVEWEVPS